MSDYTITTDFGAKDSLPSGNAAKIIKGSEFTTEFTNIKTAVNTKADTTGDTFTGAVTFDAAVTLNADVTFDTNTMFVDVSENKVGIGTTSPSQELDVVGSIRANSLAVDGGSNRYILITSSDGLGECELRLGDVSDTDAGAIAYNNADNSMQFRTNASERMRIDASGNVGIGTTSPANTLTVGDLEASAIDQDGTVGIKCNANHKGIILQENSGAEQWSMGVGEAGSLKFYDSDSTTPAVTFADISGNVGIGTTSPDRPLDITDDTNDGTGGVVIHSYLPTLELDDISGGGTSFILQHDATNTLFKHDSTEHMRIDSSGKLLLNTTTHTLTDSEMVVASEYSASGTTTGGITLSSRQSGSWRNSGIFANGADLTFTTNDTGLNGAQASSERMRIDSSGNLLVGRTSATAASGDNGIVLSPLGFIYSAKEGTSAQTHIGFINNTDATATTVGTIRTSGSTTSYNTSSDERLKENIQDADDAGSKIDAIQIRQFDWKADGLHQDYGVIAQELIEVAPEAVSEGDTEEDMMGVDYSKLVPMLIKEVQTLRNRVAQLENN